MMQHHKLAFTAALVLAMSFTLSCSSDPEGSPSSSSAGSNGGNNANVVYGDDVPYNGETYKTVKIGSQTWMARNLNYDPGTGNSGCYNNNPSSCATYGRLYDWATAMALDASCNTSSCASQITTPHQGICPSGWHIPSDADWDALMTAVGGSSTAGTKLKAREGWEPYSGVPAGTDDYGFAALPGGGGSSAGNFNYVGYFGLWWSATEGNANYAYSRRMCYNYEDVSRYDDLLKGSNLFSVRCLQD